MQILIDEHVKAVTMSVAGRFYTEEEEHEVTTAISNLLEKGQTNIVLDMQGVSSINSQGLSGLISSKKLAKKSGGDLKLSNLRPTIRELFELTRLHTVFEIFDSTQLAIQSFA